MEFSLILKDITDYIYNQLGFGLSETCYQKALQIELSKLENIKVEQEFHLQQYYTSKDNISYQLTSLRIDLLITNIKTNDNYILELKTIGKINEKEINQLKRYKKILSKTKITSCYLINFGPKELEFIKI